jgi:hypothetical protein
MEKRMSMMFDTPEGVAFVKACSRKGALELEMKGLKRSGGKQTAYSIIKEVYGFRGSRQSVLEDLTEYIEAEIRLKQMDELDFQWAATETQDLVNLLRANDEFSQPNFEHMIWVREQDGRMTHEQRQAMSDMFYVMTVRANARYR